MKKAVIATGGKQYFVTEGETLEVELLTDEKKTSFKPLLIIDDKNISIGKPEVEGSTVSAEILQADIKNDKVTAIRYKAKKRVRKVHGHRQHKTVIKITKIN